MFCIFLRLTLSSVKVVVGQKLDSLILEVLSNLNDSVIHKHIPVLQFYSITVGFLAFVYFKCYYGQILLWRSYFFYAVLILPWCVVNISESDFVKCFFPV